MNIKEKDTLIQYLYDKNYVSNFEVYPKSYIQNYELISFYIYLTDEGYNNIDKVIESFFATVNTLREEKNIQNILNNMKSIDEINFINKEEQNTIFPDDIEVLFRNYYMYGPEYMLGAPYDLLYNEKRTKEILEELSVDKSSIKSNSILSKPILWLMIEIIITIILNKMHTIIYMKGMSIRSLLKGIGFGFSTKFPPFNAL
jgi:secreted Zn-dependent insulinase-like peptidase